MKKGRRIGILCLAAVLLAAFAVVMSGIPFVREEGTHVKKQDKLCGLLITREHLELFDMERYLQDNANRISGTALSVEDNSEYQGRMYAVMQEKTLTDQETGEQQTVEEYVFDEVDGILYAELYIEETDGEGYHSTQSGSAVSDSHVNLTVTDAGEEVDMKGTIYVTPASAEKTFYFNPVYQDEQGRLYAVTGSGLSMSGDITEGQSFSHKLEEERTVTVEENGEKKTGTERFCIELSVTLMNTPVRIEVLSMNGQGELLGRQSYEPGKMPEEITPLAGTEYLIIEQYRKDAGDTERAVRELYQREEAPGIQTYYGTEDGLCIAQYTEIRWQQKTE